MSYTTDEREYPVPEFKEYRWDIQVQGALEDIDDDISTLLDESGDAFSGSHNDLSDVGSEDHHTKYTDSEAQSAVNSDDDHGGSASHNYFSGNYGDLSATPSLFSGSHGDLSDVSSGDHHTKYTDSNAQSAVDGTDRTFTSVDTDTVTISDVMNISPKSSVPSSPSANDVYLDDGTNTSSENAGFRYYDGSAWNDL